MVPRPRRETATAVYLEVGAHRVFACALDWPGWCRSGKGEGPALQALIAAGPRYAPVAAEAGIVFPPDAGAALEVVERVPGSSTTDFGAPAAQAAGDGEPLTAGEAERLSKLVGAAWTIFDHVVAGAPAELRKGPRGGGRDRDKIVQHVLAAEAAYAHKVGLRVREPSASDAEAIRVFHLAIGDALLGSAGTQVPGGKGWPPRYAARRIAWHVLDHAWESEDRSL